MIQAFGDLLVGQGDLTVTCLREAFTKTIAVWSWKRPIPPTDPQFEWFERVYNCRESDPKVEKRKESRKDKDKQAAAPEKQGLKRVREFYKKQYDAWLKEREAAEKKKKGDTKESPGPSPTRLLSCSTIAASADDAEARQYVNSSVDAAGASQSYAQALAELPAPGTRAAHTAATLQLAGPEAA